VRSSLFNSCCFTHTSFVILPKAKTSIFLLRPSSSIRSNSVGDNSFTGDLPASFANMSNLVSFIGAKNSFAENVTEPSVCDKTALLVMDCASCECCDVCCDEEHSNVCNYHDDVHTLLGFDCGAWYKSCLPVADYFANSSSALTEKEYY